MLLHAIRQFPAENGRNGRPKDIFPLLKYLTIDERVRRSHKDLDEVVLVGDKFWNNYFPWMIMESVAVRLNTWRRRRNNDRPDKKFEDNRFI
jgi:hypothetical protein